MLRRSAAASGSNTTVALFIKCVEKQNARMVTDFNGKATMDDISTTSNEQFPKP